jgi:membrane protease YdiL (CAAX protease family)
MVAPMSWARRVLRFSILRILVAAVPIVALDIGLSLLASAVGIGQELAALIAGVAAVALYVRYVHWIEQRPIHELEGTGSVPELARGFVIGVALFASTVGVLCLAGACTIERGDGVGAAMVGLAASVAAALSEEILFRAILFRIVEQRLGTWIALAVSAALFGLVHALNAGATVTSTVAIMLEAGILLAAAFVLTRRLWMVFGLHTAWNFTEGGLFGASVSGGAGHGLLASHFDGPAWLTGGAFGPEASFVAIAICLGAGIAALAIAHRRGRFLPRSWPRGRVDATSTPG